MLKGMQTPSRAAIAVEADDDGTFTVRCATTEMGQGAKVAVRTMAAELLGVGVEEVSCPDPDTGVVPYDTRTTSSRSTHMMGRALEVAVADLRGNGGRGYGEVVDEGGLDPDTGQGVASSHWHQGAAAAEVEVDEETGRFRVVKLHAPIYAGRVINRPAAELQNEGSMIMGLGTALFESNEFADGQISNANLSDYNIPAMDDMPATLSHELVEREGAEVQGLGETALPPVPPAIGNALHSLGIHVTDLPISAESVLGAVDARATATPEPLATAGGDGDLKEDSSGTGPAPEPVTRGEGSEAVLPGGVRRLPALVLLGTLGAGLLAVGLYLLVRRTGRNEGSVLQVLRR
jgi:CO/xanthine dehydrogenase Mo-binding subunit